MQPTTQPSASPSPAGAPSPPLPIQPGPAPSGKPLLFGYEWVDQTGWLPTALANAFLDPVQYGYGGNGTTIAIVGAAYPALADLQKFWSSSNGPAATVNLIPFDGGNSSPSAGDVAEATLDAETITGITPYAVTDVIEMPALADEYVGPAIQFALQQNANVVSMSFGGCETDDEAADQVIDSVAQEAAATGVTLVAAAGDAGPTCDAGTVNGVNEPASDPYVVGVGGSESLFNGGTYKSQRQLIIALRNPVVWNDTLPSDSPAGAGSGGVSQIWPIPAYQYAPGAASNTMRNVPDISFPASLLFGPAAFYLNGVWESAGGTSWSTPQFAAMQAQIDQVCSTPRWALPDLYRVAYQAPGAFVDVTSGRITWPTSDLVYAAGPGYDNASGLGMPLGVEIAIFDGC